MVVIKWLGKSNFLMRKKILRALYLKQILRVQTLLLPSHIAPLFGKSYGA